MIRSGVIDGKVIVMMTIKNGGTMVIKSEIEMKKTEIVNTNEDE
jgi:hypothetical protein